MRFTLLESHFARSSLKRKINYRIILDKYIFRFYLSSCFSYGYAKLNLSWPKQFLMKQQQISNETAHTLRLHRLC